MEVRTTNGKNKGLFADEDIKKGEYVIEYVGVIKYKEKETEYNMKYEDMNLWIDPSKKGKFVKVHESLMHAELSSRTMAHKWHAPHVLFCMRRHQKWNGINFRLQLGVGREG